jgi:hypothetical protein
MRDDKILKERLNPAGYSYANLSYNGKNEQPAVHEMVLEAFKVQRPKGVKNPVVKHKDNKKNNNKLENLEWGAISDNTEEAYSDGLIEGKGADNSDSKRHPDWKRDKTGDGDKQDHAPDAEAHDDDDDDFTESSAPPTPPEGWRFRKPKTYDEEGGEEMPTTEAPDGWKIKK